MKLKPYSFCALVAMSLLASCSSPLMGRGASLSLSVSLPPVPLEGAPGAGSKAIPAETLYLRVTVAMDGMEPVSATGVPDAERSVVLKLDGLQMGSATVTMGAFIDDSLTPVCSRMVTVVLSPGMNAASFSLLPGNASTLSQFAPTQYELAPSVTSYFAFTVPQAGGWIVRASVPALAILYDGEGRQAGVLSPGSTALRFAATAGSSWFLGAYNDMASPLFITMEYERLPAGSALSTFGSNGSVLPAPLGAASFDSVDSAFDARASGYVVVAASDSTRPGGVAVSRYTYNGLNPDAGFGESGWAWYFPADPSLKVAVRAVTVDSSGRVLVAGSMGAIAPDDLGFVLRFAADGRLDAGFADRGVYLYDQTPGPPDFFMDLSLAADGSIFLAGGAYLLGQVEPLAVKLGSTGAYIDGTIENLSSASGHWQAVYADSLDGVVYAGTALNTVPESRSLLRRYPQTDFSGGSNVSWDLAPGQTESYEAIAPSAQAGKLVLLGVTGDGDFNLTRIALSGSSGLGPDGSFTGDGQLLVHPADNADAKGSVHGSALRAGLASWGGDLIIGSMTYLSSSYRRDLFVGQEILLAGYGSTTDLARETGASEPIGPAPNPAHGNVSAAPNGVVLASCDAEAGGRLLVRTVADMGTELATEAEREPDEVQLTRSWINDTAVLRDGSVVAVGGACNPSGVVQGFVAKYRASGEPDETFGGDGWVDYGDGTNYSELFAVEAIDSAAGLPSEDSILVAGSAYSSGYGFVTLAYANYRLDGTTRANQTYNGGAFSAVYGLAWDGPRNRVLLACRLTNPSNSVAALAVVPDTGSPVGTYGSGGYAIVAIGTDPRAVDVGLRSTGQAVLLSETFLSTRLYTHLAVIGVDGESPIQAEYAITAENDHPRKLLVRTDGSVLVAGTGQGSDASGYVAAYSVGASIQPLNLFGAGNVLSLGSAGLDTALNGAVMFADGGFALSGSREATAGGRFVPWLCAFLADGSPDLAFGSGGAANVAAPAGDTLALGLGYSRSGILMLVGSRATWPGAPRPWLVGLR